MSEQTKKAGRPKLPQGSPKSKSITISLNENEIVRLDTERGKQNRSAFIRAKINS
jgi:hypothetical protein